jgi:DNA-binding transcriptional ArsR family regulator
MVHTTAVAEIGALVGDPARANMLAALLDGRALTAKELAERAGVAPQTTSGHLAKLVAAGLIEMSQQGRRRYHRLTSPEIAQMLESIMNVAGSHLARDGARPVRVGPADIALRAARTCYDHLAGRLAVDLADAMAAHGLVELGLEGGALTESGRTFLENFGVDVETARQSKRAFCRPCLDWSERRPHLAGAVGAALLQRTLELNWIRRLEGTRAVMITPKGQSGFQRTFGFAPSPKAHGPT